MPNEISIGNAVINFGANTRELVDGFREVRTTADSVGVGIEGLRNRLRNLVDTSRVTNSRLAMLAKDLASLRTAFTLALGTAGAGFFVKQTSETVASLFELSIRTGETVASLQNLQRVFQGDGIEIEQFDKFVIQLTRSLGAARAGLSSYADAFADLGININNVESVRDLILQISDAVSSGRVGRDTALYALQTLGGRSGAATLNVLLQGREGIEAAEESFARLGNVTQEQAADLKVLAQAQQDFASGVQVGFQQLLGNVALDLIFFVEQMTRLLPVVFNTLGAAIMFVRDNLWAVRLAIIAIGTAFVLRIIFKLSLAFLVVTKALELLGFVGNINLRNILVRARMNTAEFVRTNLTLRAMAARLRAVHAASVRANRDFLGRNIWLTRTQRTNAAVRALVRSIIRIGPGIRTGAVIAVRSLRLVRVAALFTLKAIGAFAIPVLLFEGLYRAIRFFIDLRAEAERTGETLASLFRTTLAFLASEAVRIVLTFRAAVRSFIFSIIQYISEFSTIILTGIGDIITAFYQTYIRPFIIVTNAEFDKLWNNVREFARIAFDRIVSYALDFNNYLNEQWGVDLLAVAETTFNKVQEFAETAFSAFKEFAFEVTASVADNFKSLLQSISEGTQSIGQRLADALGIPLLDPNDFSEVSDGLDSIIGQAQEQLDGDALRITITPPEIEEDDIITAAAKRTITELSNVEFRFGENFEDQANEIKNFTDGLLVFTDVTGRANKSLEAHEERLLAVRRALGLEEPVDEALTNLEKLSNVADLEFSKISESAGEAADAVEERLSTAASSIGDAFGNFTGTVIKDFRSIGDAVRNLARQIIDALVKRFVVNPISNFVGNLVGGLFPGLQGGGLGRGLTLVGEAGPEIVDFRQPGRVYSNDQLRDAIVGRAAGVGGNEPVVVNITVNSSDSGAVTRAINDALPAIVETVKGVVGIDASRPSALNSQLQRAF